MSNKKRKILEKQGKRSLKLLGEVLTGMAKIAIYEPPQKQSQANRKGGSTPTTESEVNMAAHYIRLLKLILPGILYEMSSLEDYRNEKRCVHTLPTLIVYGIIAFLALLPSRRATNREIGGESAFTFLCECIPELKTMPHADTLARLLENIDVNGIEAKYEKMLVQFIKSDEFRKMNPGKCLIMVDGTQKYSLDYSFDEHAIGRHRGEEDRERYCVYILESVLILGGGIVIPLLTETLENDGVRIDSEQAKQDCEQKAFKRLAERLSKVVGTGCATIVADGLYACGPVVSLCKYYGWGFMIVLKRKCLTSVWEDFDGLRKCEPENNLIAQWGERVQTYYWSNGIEYTYGNNHKRLSLNVVTCKEEWMNENPQKGGRAKRMVTEYAWLSSDVVTVQNVVLLCNEIARRRWRIENHFKVEKHNGYGYSHVYSLNWNAMKGYHCLMKIAHFINTLIINSDITQEYVKVEGYRGFVEKAWRLVISGRLNKVEITVLQTKQSKLFSRGSINYKALKLIA
ncbi:MAG: transposase family protein [Holophagales bacterium]|jgi:hypothetical protein|nr:transposase family protein [Holophagales bacterium]